MTDSAECGDPEDVEYGKAVSAVVISVWIGAFNIPVMALLIKSLIKHRVFSVPKLFTLALSTVDFSFAVFTVVPTTVNYWRPSCHHHCTYLGFTTVFFMLMSQMCVVLMSIERFTALCFPFKYHKIFSLKSAFAMFTAVLTYSLVVSIMPILGVSDYVFFRGYWCYFDLAASTTPGRAFAIFFTIQGLMCTVAMVMCNICSVMELCRMRRRVNVVSNNPEAGTAKEQTIFFIWMMLGASAIFIIFTTPMLIRIIFNQAGQDLSAPKDYSAMRLSLFNNMLNAQVYFFLRVVLNRSTRDRIKSLCCYGFQSTHAQQVETHTTVTEVIACTTL